MRWIVLCGVWWGYTLFGLVATSIAPLVPRIQNDLMLNYSQMGALLGAWQLTYVVAAMPCGALLDRLGSRRALTLGLLLIAGSAFGRAAAQDFESMLIAVMLFGLGGPVLSSGAPKIVASIFSGRQRGLAMGIYITGATIGSIIALTITHSLMLPLLNDSWRRLMVVWGMLTCVVAGFWFLLATRAERKLEVLKPTAAADIKASLRSHHAVIGMIRNRSVQLVLLMAVATFSLNHGLNNWLPALLRSDGMSVVEAGYWSAIPSIVGVFGSLIIPTLATPSRRFGILFWLCVSAAIASLLLCYQQPQILSLSLILYGIARSSLMALLMLVMLELPEIEPRNAGVAGGLFFSAAEVGGLLGPLSLGLLHDLSGGFLLGLYFLASVAALMAGGSVALARRVNQPVD